MGTKQEVIAEIFKMCQNKKDFTFDNTIVKQLSKKYKFGNPFDVTKVMRYRSK
jgi:hypothetical protein